MRILVIEDERALCETIVRSLKRLAYSVDFCYDGNKANELLGIEKYDLVLLDLNLPGADGMTVLRTLRQTDRDTGVLILSARCEVADKVEGLDAGANDYLTKPFHLEELEARIRSLTRRRFTQNNVVLNCGKVAFDTKARVAVADGQELSLTRKEIGILEYLLLNQGRPVSQEELLDSGKYRVLRVGNFFTKNSWYYSDMELEDNKYCYPDDLLFCWSASFGLYIWNDVKTIYHYHIWKIDFSKTAPYYREYIFLYLKQELNKLSKEGHGSVMAHLTKSGVENLDIVSPPEEIIKQFHNSIIPFIEHKKLVEKEVQQLTELRESILSKMVS